MGLGKSLVIGGALGLGIGAIVTGLITKNVVENKYFFSDGDDEEDETTEIEEVSDNE